MEWIETVSRVAHILAGAIALVSGLLALGFFKVIKTHCMFGKIFFYAMTMVFITAIHLSTVHGIDFLFCIAVLSYFSTYHGVRSLLFWKGTKSNYRDWTAALLTVGAGLYLIAKAAFSFNGNIRAEHIVYLAFGTLTSFLAIQSIRSIKTIETGNIKWFESHRGNMGGALIATITAFSVTAIDFLPDLVAWLGPTIILTPLLTLLIRKTNKIYGIANQA
ncbi:MAG: hypothetical protein HN542_03170 [Flavobacteriales bacterium]|jgi:hypothetical protein|nr:hypothetical protein [Flavobacteriales bacterium]MBT3964229.1 hypothetical protein [Flavobacteriales bacterium]MBT4704138.1 hypothetical protein [Flavobacteriales bacterium]MBT4930042.1 hypothetical protein [Flavobacteriales bacterium]MBT5132416.1 hypothetical protein [Flavobacteriales bacterium]